MTKLCVSIPVHEELPVVIDQVRNFRTWLPDDTVIVLHLAQGFSDPRRVQQMLPEGVYVNPTSLPTAWGDVLSTHNANFRFINEVEEFDYFVIHASNDLYVRAGAETYIGTADAGVQQTPLHPYHEKCPNLVPGYNPRDIACQDPAMQALLKSLGTEEIRHTQVEGIWFNRALFADIVDITDLFWNNGERNLVAPEHYFYPTVAQTLTQDFAYPVVYFDAQYPELRQVVTPALVRSLRMGTLQEDVANEWVAPISSDVAPMPAHYDYDNLYAVKRVERQFADPLRQYIRALSREHQAPVRLQCEDELASFVCLAFGAEVLNDLQMLKSFAAQFRDHDDACLVLAFTEDQATLIPQLEAASAFTGLNADDGPNVVALVTPADVEANVMFAGICDVVCTADTLNALYEDALVLKPHLMSRLRRLAELKWKGQRLC